MPTGNLEHLTLRDLECMPRADLMSCLEQFAKYFPVSLDQGVLTTMPETSLRQLVNLARRKFQSLGY